MANTSISLKTPAKINLFLEVKDKRSDGYHNIYSIMQTVSLFDEIKIETLQEKDVIEIECSDKNIPTDERNIVYKVAKAIKEEFNIKSGVKIYIDKQIPVSAGLGGGSSDGAAIIKGLSDIWNIEDSKQQLKQIASKIGADITFFLKGGTAFCEGIGDIITPMKSMGKKNIILVNPGFSVSTAQVYQRIKFPLTNTRGIHKIATLFDDSSLYDDEDFYFNRLEEFVFPYHPEILKIKNTLKDLQCISLMSGSGATVFGIAKSEFHSEKVCKEISKYGWKVWNVRSL
jgi:4-diphosphocytidyl-2-C-methyl-D-erythritol kinase